MKPERNFTDKIEYVFSSRPKPAQVRLADEVFQLDFEVEEALWFSGRDWHEITWQDWQEHSSAIYFSIRRPSPTISQACCFSRLSTRVKS